MYNTNRSFAALSQTWTFFEGAWQEGNSPIMGPRTHGAWLGSTVFDGARAFDGVTPDLDMHFRRVNFSAEKMRLEPLVPLADWLALTAEGMRLFDPSDALYIRPMYWAERGYGGGVRFDPASTQWCLCIYEAPMPEPAGLSITLSPYRRPSADTAPVEAKAGCLYPNNARAMMEALSRGFDNCLMCDLSGNVAELANSNIFLVKDEIVYTPAINGVFLDGITRRRVIGLLRTLGVSVIETSLTYAEFLTADEIFATGNYAKVTPVTRIDGRSLVPGPVFRKAREAYWQFAHDTKTYRERPAPVQTRSYGPNSAISV